MIGCDTSGKIGLYKYDGVTETLLASEPGNSFATYGALQRVDVELANYGASATVNVYLRSILLFTFTGDVTVSGMTAVDCVLHCPNASGNTGYNAYVSEVMVTVDDSRTRQVTAHACFDGERND